MRRRGLLAYVGTVAALAGAAIVAVALGQDAAAFERPWLIAAFAAAIVVEHLFATRLAHEGDQGETTTHEESFLVAAAFLLAPLDVLAVFAAGFLGGNLLLRRSPLKAVFNVATMIVCAAVAVATISGIRGGDELTPRALVAVAAGTVAFVVVNRLLIAGVLALAGGARFAAALTDDLRARTLVSAANASIGFLAGLAAATELWTLPVGLVALVALHFAFTGHARARAERQKLADVVASSSDGIVSIDANGRVRSWNPACEEMTGYPADHVLGLALRDVGRMLAAERELSGDDSSTRAPSTAQIRTADGATRWIRISRAPLPEGGYVLVVHDETTRRHVDEIRAQQDREQIRSDLVATVSHELRTPLTSILGFAQTLLRRDNDGDRHKRYLEIIVEEAKRLKNLIDDLLDIRVAAAGGFTVEFERLDIATAVADEVAIFAEQTDTHVVKLERPPLPLWVRGDPQRLRQVVANLISNAIKYSPRGGEIFVLAARANGQVRVAVSDRGVGIPADQQAEIFTRFFRVRSPDTRAVPGAGLGLAVSRAIIESHGGRIGFESTEREGSTFYFELPAYEQDEDGE